MGCDSGERHVYQELLDLALRGLGYDCIDGAALLQEREEAIVALRRICERHGDNEWNERLALADILEKHLERYLEEDA